MWVLLELPRFGGAEFGIVAPVGRQGVEALLEVVADVGDRE